MEYGSTILVAPYEIVAVRMRGIRSSYPPEISAIRKIAVIGACMTPAIRPDMPTRTKFCSGTTAPPPIRLMVLDTTNPAIAPINSVGPNVPPTPPPAFVKDMENTFRSRIIKKKIGTDHGFRVMNANTVCPSKSMTPPLRSS